MGDERTSVEESRVTSYNHDAAVELAQAESICREWLPFSRDGEAICWVMVEYDRRAAEIEELRRQRAAVLLVAAELEMLAEPSVKHGKWILGQLARKLRAAEPTTGVEA